MDQDTLARCKHLLNAREQILKHRQAAPFLQRNNEHPAENGEEEVIWGVRLMQPSWGTHIRRAIDLQTNVVVAQAFQVARGIHASLKKTAARLTI